jgi:hypothetical protein
VAERQHRALRVFAGIAAMAAFVLVALAVVVQYAGSWGVPYFSFTSERGSPCRNDLSGYTCSPLTLADLEFYGDVDLPDDSKMISGTYKATHDYQLDATVEVPKASASAALTGLKEAYGECQASHPGPLNAKSFRNICVLSNDDVVSSRSSEPSSRLYLIGTGLSKDGTRRIVITMKSR